MAKNLRITLLLDFYGTMLTDKQQEAVELYYNEDLSLGEMAAYFGISRQGVRDNIKRAESVLLELEERLGLAERFSSFEEGIAEIVQSSKDIIFALERDPEYYMVVKKAQNIIAVASKLRE